MKVNWLKVCTVGLEVLLAVGTGIAVFAGISKATGNTQQANNSNVGSSEGGSFTPPTNNNTPSNENKFATGLRATQSSMEKIIAVVGSLAVAAECIGAVFGKTEDRRYNQMPWYGGYNNGWMTPTQPAYSGVGLRQVTPFVQEVGYYPNH